MKILIMDLPITEEDLDDLRETMDPSGTCLVCLGPCKAWSNDLFLYTCHCIYRIHPECFKMWRSTTGTDRVCLICREEFDTFGYIVAEPERPPLVLIRHEEPRQETILMYLAKIGVALCVLIITGYTIAFSRHALR